MEAVHSAGLTGVLIIDIGIGVIFALLTFSLIASAIQEALAGILNWRGRHLKTGILHILSDETLGDAVLSHPLIDGLKGPKAGLRAMFGVAPHTRMPSAIPKGTFAKALIESLAKQKERFAETEGNVDKALARIDEQIEALAVTHEMKARLRQIVRKADMTADETFTAVRKIVDEAEAELALWFDNAMDRVTGWYVRRVKTVLFAVGFLMAAAVNFDLIGYAQELSRNDELRNRIVQQAELAAQSRRLGEYEIGGQPVIPADGDAAETLKQVREEALRGLETLKVQFEDRGAPIGWDNIAGGAPSMLDWLRMLTSWLILGVGCTLGGQFWFDLLKRALNVRAGASGLNSDIREATASTR